MKKEFVADFDYEFEEKHKTISVTEQGVAKAERFLGIDHLYRAENGHLVNHLIQSLKAESLYKRDVDYAVIDGEVKIIDEFTGRILEGRRWSEGLHQAVEAKEGVRVQEENQTLATITLQNYFRMYDKLAGMTGTAITEATEFMKIYNLPVVEIPTNRPMVRADNNDQVYKTKDGKASAIVREIEERHSTGQPVLVGTISVEVSEQLSDELKAKGIQHSVLNAKPEYAEREGETIAEAGAPGAVTIATNMAGRGVDIKLGGNAEHLASLEMAKLGLEPGDPDYDEHYRKAFGAIEARVEDAREQVLELGGLYILGTERHESRRIDNQLRGRSGRQGDPGESRFFLSAQDDLVRLFAGERIYKILDRLGSIDDEGNEEPIEHGMLSKQIEKAQRKVEEQHFLTRKHTLEYDDVLNQQREVIYTYRDEVLEGRDMSDAARHELGSLIDRLVGEYTAGDFVEEWDVEGLLRRMEEMFPPDADVLDVDPLRVDREQLVDALQEQAGRVRRREEEFGPELMRDIERFLLLQIIDQRWREHLYDMDYLREGIHLRGFAQIEPLVAYKNEAFELFRDLMNSVWEDYARLIFHVEVTPVARGMVARHRRRRRRRGARAAPRARPPAGEAGHVLRRRWRAGRDGDRRRGRRAARPRTSPPRTSRDGAGRAAPRRSRRADRPQRPVLVRLGQEVQEVPRGIAAAGGRAIRPARVRRAARSRGCRDPRALRRGPPDRRRALRARAGRLQLAHRAGARSSWPTCRSSRPPAQQKAELAARRSMLQRRLLQEAGGGSGAFLICTVIWIGSGASGFFWPIFVALGVLVPLVRNGWRLYGPAPEFDEIERDLDARRHTNQMRNQIRSEARGRAARRSGRHGGPS